MEQTIRPFYRMQRCGDTIFDGKNDPDRISAEINE